MKFLLLILTLAAAATAVWYIAFHEPATPGVGYQNTYALISLAAALIFATLMRFRASDFGFRLSRFSRRKGRPERDGADSQ
ncbi:MAG: hypothetical protein JSS81_06535 [Acidobacteria bacterium]|nr:hypothetical protein [Acidobacteriota bacterium]